MLVCRSWRDMIQSDPNCWTRISFCNWEYKTDAHQHQLCNALEKSGSLHLDIVVHVSEACQGLAMALMLHIGRIRTLHLSALNDFKIAGFLTVIILAIKRMGKLKLEELIIRTIEEGREFSSRVLSYPLEQILFAAPALRVLQFPPYAGEMPILDGLRSGIPSLSSLTLALAGTQETNPPTGLLTFISECPNLKSLTFTACEMEWGQFPFEDESQASFREFDVDIPLPLQFLQLTSLTVSCPTTGVLILLSINAPNLQSVTLDGRDTQPFTEWDNGASEQPDIALRTLSKRSPGLVSLEIIELPMSYHTWFWLFHGSHAGYGDPTHSIEAPAAPFPKLRSLVVDELSYKGRMDRPLEPGIEAIVKGMGDSIDDAELPSLERLHLRSVTTISGDALIKFVRRRNLYAQDNKALTLELMFEHCEAFTLEHISELFSLPRIALTCHRTRRDDLFPRSWVRLIWSFCKRHLTFVNRDIFSQIRAILKECLCPLIHLRMILISGS